jgi:NADH dehydrogenase FAD-containing subunit
MAPPKTIIVGAGVAGIAMGHTLKWKLGYNNFEVSIIPIATYEYLQARSLRNEKA